MHYLQIITYSRAHINASILHKVLCWRCSTPVLWSGCRGAESCSLTCRASCIRVSQSPVRLIRILAAWWHWGQGRAVNQTEQFIAPSLFQVSPVVMTEWELRSWFHGVEWVREPTVLVPQDEISHFLIGIILAHGRPLHQHQKKICHYLLYDLYFI